MKALDLVTLIILIIAGLNLGILGITGSVDIIGMILGSVGWLYRIWMIIVGLSAIYQLLPLSRQMST